MVVRGEERVVQGELLVTAGCTREVKPFDLFYRVPSGLDRLH